MQKQIASMQEKLKEKDRKIKKLGKSLKNNSMAYSPPTKSKTNSLAKKQSKINSDKIIKI